MTEQQKQGERQYKGSFVISDETATLSGNQITYNLQNQETFTELDLSQYSFTQTIYNVASAYGNSTLTVRVNGGANLPVAFPDGFYTAEQALTFLCDRLNTIAGGTHFTYVLTNYKFTITISGGRTLRFIRGSTPQSNNVYDMLGLIPTQLVFSSDIVTTLEGQNYVNFTNTLMLQVSCQQLLPKWNINQSNYIYFIPLSAGFGYTQTGAQQLDEDNAYVYYEGQQTSLRQLTFSLFDQNNRPITVPSNWSYAFKFDAYI